MAISFIGANAANGNSVTIPSHQAGDLLLIGVYRHDSNAAITVPSGWFTELGNGGATNRINLHWRIAEDAASTAGTWSNATQIIAAVYRADNYLVPSGSSTTQGTAGSGNNVTYPAIQTASEVTNKWHIGLIGHRRTNTDIATAPSGMINRASIKGATDGEIALHDTNANSAGWSNTAYTLTAGTSDLWRLIVAEIAETAIKKTASSSGIPIGRLISGGV